jgi:predicted tellurium resistance membrane protein TerC
VTYLLTVDTLVSLVSLSAMEIVLGIDNVVFIAILTARLPEARQALARQLGMAMALGMRIGLLFAISSMMRLTRPLVTVPVLAQDFSGRDIILILGGLFLIFKATWES